MTIVPDAGMAVPLSGRPGETLSFGSASGAPMGRKSFHDFDRELELIDLRTTKNYPRKMLGANE
jgi:hypothetical protein